MARVDLSNPTKRDALKQRTSYYAHPLGSKRYVLMRVGKTGRTWGARVPGRPDKGLGPVEAMTFDQVADLVRQMDNAPADETPDDLVTVGTALDAYEASSALTKGKRPMATIRSHLKLMGDLRDQKITDIRLATLNRWRDGLVGPDRGIATTNKIVGTLKAALNAHGIDGDWQKLRKLKEPEKGIEDRAAILTPDQVRSILKHLHNSDPDMWAFVRALWLTGARPGEIRSAPNGALVGNALTLSGKTGTRIITLTPGVTAFFAEQAARGGKYLFEFEGKPITSDMYLDRWNALPDDLVPAGVTAYALRHGHITAALYENVPIFAVAKQCGTSPEMIQATYGHVIASMQSQAFGALEQVLL